MLGSGLLSLVGASVIILSALRFRELSKRFFAIRLIFFLALTDACASAFNILGAFVDVDRLVRPEPGEGLPVLCLLQAVGLLYFNLSSILWTCCFAFTLYRDVVPSYRRQALRRYEAYFHMLCWPVPAGLTLAASYFGDLGDAGSWCALSLQYSEQYLICFYLPLLAAFTFNLVTYSCVLSHSRERRVSRITSLYLLGFAVVWLPSLICRTQVFLSPTHTLTLPPAALEALCMPLQGALNALVYGWSLPSIRDVYRTMLLGTDGLDALQITHEDRECSLGSLGSYSPPDHDAGLPSVLQPYPPPPGSLACLGGSVGSSGGGCGGAALPAGVSPLSAMGAVAGGAGPPPNVAAVGGASPGGHLDADRQGASCGRTRSLDG